ncbi:Endonuclease/exonuclease/phosphatase [Fennellomyces sp. T-0311]|nr:Endonuclease/exonuclease/phosphatase [Fennellomyces sp. T-0311]
MNTTHDDSNSERITLRSNEGIRRPEPEDDPESPHNGEREEEEEPMEQQQRAPLLQRSYSQESGISTDSAPPPYEVYPPAKTFLGRAYNWLRQIPRIRRHQAIALPTLPLHRSRHSHDSLSSTSIDSFASSAYPATCCSYYYYSLVGYLPSCPRFILPHRLARCRGILICISFFALFIFAFLLFCSIFFSPASLSPSGLPDLVTDTSARFLTLNIFMRPPGVTNNWSDYKDDRVDYIVRYILPQYDVVAFQEAFAFGTRRKDELIQRARNMGYNHHVESPRHYPWDFGVDGGLLILSRFPIRTSHAIEYPRGIHSDWLSYKGALHALIELNPTHSIHVYTTHAQASYTGTNSQSQADTQVRMSQFSQLHQFISETAQRDNVPILLLGDFNVDAAVHGPGRPITEPSKESSQEYDMMLDVLRGNGVDPALLRGKRQRKRVYADTWHMDQLTDVVYEQYHYHPVTFGDVMLNGNGQLEPAETILTDMDEAMTVQSIDRILWDKARASSLTIHDAQVEKFLVRSNDLMSEHDKQQAQFTQVSDHYGLSCVVQLA